MHNKKAFHFSRNNILISHHPLGVGNSLFRLLPCRCIAFRRACSSWDRCHNNKRQFGCYWDQDPADIWLGISKFLDRNVLHAEENLLHCASNWRARNHLQAACMPRIEALKRHVFTWLLPQQLAIKFLWRWSCSMYIGYRYRYIYVIGSFLS